MATKQEASMSRLFGSILVFAAIVFLGGGVRAQDKKSLVDIDSVFKKLDTNSDNKLQKDEFLKLAEHFKDKGKAREKLTTAFSMIDAQKKGFLSKDQFRTYYESAKKQRIQNP
jgi:Ca2+-binding EF-hand superfamily protein